MAIPLGGKSSKIRRSSNHTRLNSELEASLKPDPVFKGKEKGKKRSGGGGVITTIKTAGNRA